MLNRFEIIGRSGNVPEIKRISDTLDMTVISIASSEKIKGKKITTWNNVSYFNKQAEIAAKYIKKGSLLYVEGRIKTTKYTDKEGKQRTYVELQGNKIIFLGGDAGYEMDDYTPQEGDPDIPV